MSLGMLYYWYCTQPKKRPWWHEVCLGERGLVRGLGEGSCAGVLVRGLVRRRKVLCEILCAGLVPPRPKIISAGLVPPRPVIRLLFGKSLLRTLAAL